MSDAAATFIATFLGVAVVFVLQYVYDKHVDDRRDRNDIRKVLSTISHELSYNLERLNDPVLVGPYQKLQEDVRKSTGDIVLPNIILARMALDSAIHSGKLFLLKEETVEIFTEDYRRIDVINVWSEQVRSLQSKPVDKTYLPVIAYLTTTIDGYADNLTRSLPVTIQKLECLLT